MKGIKVYFTLCFLLLPTLSEAGRFSTIQYAEIEQGGFIEIGLAALTDKKRTELGEEKYTLITIPGMDLRYSWDGKTRLGFQAALLNSRLKSDYPDMEETGVSDLVLSLERELYSVEHAEGLEPNLITLYLDQQFPTGKAPLLSEDYYRLSTGVNLQKNAGNNLLFLLSGGYSFYKPEKSSSLHGVDLELNSSYYIHQYFSPYIQFDGSFILNDNDFEQDTFYLTPGFTANIRDDNLLDFSLTFGLNSQSYDFRYIHAF